MIESLSDKRLTDLQRLLAGAIRRQGLTQGELAKRLSISRPTLKRWLVGRGLGFTDLLRLLDNIGLSLADVSAALTGFNAATFQYTLVQEEFLAARIGHLAYFDKLLEGCSPLNIKRRFRLSDRAHRRYLRDLEEIGLLVRLPRERIQLLVRGEPVWKRGGPLAKALRGRALGEMIENHADHIVVALHRYKADDARRLKRLTEDLMEMARGADRRARQSDPEDSVAFGLVLGLPQFVPSFMQRVPDF